ncbi:ABC transporter ATP-binding protein [Aeribacillus pallidus]|nr:ABC transporter ATP-binding protein [Aeribacillus pallidus]
MTLLVENVSTYHGKICAVHQVNFHVEDGEIVSIIGANGAGKSTLLGTISGIYKPSEGKITLNGKNISGLPAYKVVRNGVSLVPEGRQIFSSLSVKENLILGMFHQYRSDRKTVRERIEKMLNMFPGLVKHLNNPAGNLSGGEQQMLAIARSLMSNPQVILLDEPSMGLAPMIVKEIMDIMKKIKNDLGTKVLLVEQNVKAALNVADRAYVMDQGHFILEGKALELLHNPMVQQSYLGKSSGEGEMIPAK